MDRFRFIARVEGVSAGVPIVKGTGIGVWMLASRFAAGESIEAIADDYHISVLQVTDAIRLVVAATFGQRGMLFEVERRMDRLVELVP